MIPQEKAFPRWMKAPVALILLALLVGGTLFYQKASGQEQREQGAPSVQMQSPNATIQSLTEEERKWLKEHPVIRVVQDPGWPPVEFADDRGEPSGISNDYLNLIEQRLGIKFERVRNLSWQESYARLKRWDIDMTTCVAVTPERTGFWAFTKPYMTIPIVILTNADVTYIADMRELEGKKVAVVDGYVPNEWIQRDFPDIQLVKVNSVKDGLELLQKGDVFAFVQDMLVTSYYMAKLKFFNFKVAGATPYVNAQCMAVRKDWAILAGILQKAMESISETERAQIYQKWVPIRYEHGFDYKLLWQSLAIFALILGTLVVWNRRLSREIRFRREAETALRESEGKYMELVDNANSAIIRWKSDGTLTFFNEYAQEVFGYNADEAVGKHVSILVPERDSTGSDLSTLVQDIVNHPQRYVNNVNENVCRDGSRVWMVWTNKPIRDEEGQVVEILAVGSDVTDRKKGEEALRQSEEKFSKAFHASPDVLVISQRDTGRIIETNEKWESTFGYKRGETIGRSSLEMGLFENPEVRSNVIRKLVEQGFVRDYEVNIRRKSGEIRQTLLSAESIEIGGEPYVLTMVHDITKRKRAEEALRTSEAQLSNAVVMAHLGHWEYDVANDLFTFNDHFYKIFRTTAEEVGGYTMSSTDYARRFVHPDDISVVADETRKAIETSDPFFNGQLEHRMLYADGEIGYIAVRFFIVKDKTGQTIKTYGVNQDITERKRVEEALYESETRYRVLFNDSKDGVYITERDGRLIEANEAYFDLFGYTREEIIGGDIRTIYVNPSERNRFAEAIETRGFLRDYPLAFKRKDGKEIDCLLTSSLRRASDGTILGYQGIIRDITEQKNLQKQLLQAQKMEAIGTLAGGIAHDFNNILTVVLGFSDLLLAQKDEKDQDYADLRKILRAGKNGAELVQRLLMFSRKSEPKPIPMNLNKQIVQVEKLLRRTIPRMIDIQLELSADLPEINADQSQVEQVVMNLAVNVRDSMPESDKLTLKTEAVTLDEEYCRLHVEATPGEYVLLSVSDTGHGMHKETLQHIFEPFFTTKEIGRGTGLGLAMVYGIVNQHAGHITCYSEVGQGTTFRVYLPAMEGEVETDVETTTIMPAFGTETVLVVDDEDLVRDLGARILTKHGYTVIKAANGREALDVFGKERSGISLVILDLIMPEMGGTECLKELLKIDPKVKVLIASGFSADTSIKESIQMGAKGFVTKPFRVKEILRDVRRVLDQG